ETGRACGGEGGSPPPRADAQTRPRQRPGAREGVMRPYRLLLLLYPASFRGEYGDEMTALVRHRLRDAGGPLARLVTWIGIAAETAVNAGRGTGEITTQER